MQVKTSLYEVLLETKIQSPNNNALLFMKKYVTYEELIKNIDLVSAGLYQLGIRAGDKVTMAMPNVFEAIYSFYAVNRLGAIAHFVHPLTPVKQISRFMEKLGSKTLMILDTFYDHYKEVLELEGTRLILANPTDSFSIVKKLGYAVINRKKRKGIVYSNRVIKFKELLKYKDIPASSPSLLKADSVYLHSGGTSGEPKTICLSDFAINSLASKTSYILGETEFKDRHMLAVLPLFHGFGLCMGIHAMLAFGGVDTLMPKYDSKETIELLKNNQVNYVIGVPSLFENLISHPEVRGAHLKNLHQAFVGGDYVALDLKYRFDRLMKEYGSKARLLEGYGLTEVVTVCAVNTLQDHLQTSVGKVLPGLEINIVDLETREFLPKDSLGEIVVSGDTMMNGYLESESSTEVFLSQGKKTWVLTGDYGFIDQEGYLHFKQRLKRIIKVSGMPVLPSEIENLIMNMSDVKEVSAVGVPDEQRGNMIKLFVVASALKEEILTETIKQTIKEELGIYAVPKEIVYLETLPKTIIGKVDTRQLEKM